MLVIGGNHLSSGWLPLLFRRFVKGRFGFFRLSVLECHALKWIPPCANKHQNALFFVKFGLTNFNAINLPAAKYPPLCALINQRKNNSPFQAEFSW